VNTQLATTLGAGSATVSTVEHVLAALQGMGIDNALLEVDGPEVPIMDEVLAHFVRQSNVPVLNFKTNLDHFGSPQKVEIKIGEKWAFAEPSSRFQVHGSIDWDHPSIGYQEFFYEEGRTSFDELASARTFGFLREWKRSEKLGLAQGGSLENAVVLDHALVLNPEGLRFPDEFVRHKVLDALGTLNWLGFQS
jgi:UDP-3-O-[3-hydroxymyristoyl] N-acetylglucosamine deacetylase